jgi:diguanylate cyclase (GGDEF)-like protein
MMRVAPPRRVSRIIMPASIALASAILTIVAFALWQAREDARTRALRESENIVQAIEADIARNVELYDLSLQGMQEALATEAVAHVGQEVRRLTLFDHAASAEYMGAMYVLNAAAEIVICSRSTTADPRLKLLDLSDRDYFQVHQYRPDVGLYISPPFKGRLERHEDRIALSRRLTGKDGKFAGIVVGTLRLSYFRDLFSRLNVGRRGLITLARSDGTILMRHPSIEGDFDIGGSFKGTPIFERILRERSGSFMARSTINGMNRLFTFRQIAELPLFVAVDQAVDDIFAGWWRRAIAIGSVTLILAIATIVLAAMFRSAQHELAAAAVTDELTGLANRRCFERMLQLEWRRAARINSPLALLMIDVDNFKLFNDQNGHCRADDVLREFGRLLRNCGMRAGDLAARYGGEEFAVILPNTNTKSALVVAERIQSSMLERPKILAG